MILVDLNQVMISNLMGQLHSSRTNEVDEDLLRHMVLNGIRSYRNKFSEEYGELVICCDDTNNWRKDSFPYYKAHRKTNRDESDLDWPNIFNCLNAIRDELKEFFPYKHIRVNRCEADDIIGTICHQEGVAMGDGKEKILILSGDKAIVQKQMNELRLQLGKELNLYEKDDKSELFMSINKAKFRKPVLPNYKIKFYVEMMNNVKNVYKFMGKAYYKDTLVAESEFSAMITGK